MRVTRTDALLLRGLYLLAAGIVCFQVLGMEALVSALFTGTFFLTGFLWLSAARRAVDENDLLAYGIIVLAFANVCLNAWLTGAEITGGYFKKLVMFAVTVLYLTTAGKLRADAALRAFLARLNDAVAVFLTGALILARREMYMLNGQLSGYLTFRFSNPNFTGMLLVCVAMLEAARLFAPGRRAEKGLRLLLCACLAFFVYETRSRSALLVLCGFALACLWLRLTRRSRFRIRGWAAAAAAGFPLVFALLYLPLIRGAWVRRVLSFLAGEGKRLTSRAAIWSFALRRYLSSPILGAYSQIRSGTGHVQMHNTHVDLLASYGPAVLVGVCVLLYRLLRQADAARKSDFVFLLGFLCCLALGAGEAALFSGGLGIYLFAGGFLLLADAPPEEAEVCA